MKVIILLLASFSIYSQNIIGTWINTELKVDYEDKEDLLISEENWEEKLKIKPIRTTFYPNGKYRSIYRDINDSVVRKVEGRWEIEADSIYLIQMKPEISIEKYAYKIEGNIIKFSAVMDFDQDGIVTDKYYGKQKRVETKVEEFLSGEMKQYFFVLIKRGEKTSQSDEEKKRLQMGHLQNIRDMAMSGKLQVAGPFAGDIDLRGIFILDVESEEEAWELIKKDPAYQAGKFEYEVYPWWTEVGAMIR